MAGLSTLTAEPAASHDDCNIPPTRPMIIRYLHIAILNRPLGNLELQSITLKL